MIIKYKVGDVVRFLNDTGGGTITRIDEQGMVYVQSEDGFEVPALSSELIPADGFIQEIVSEKSNSGVVTVAREPLSKKKESEKGLSDKIKLPENLSDQSLVNLLLGFVPENPGPVFSSNIECYLINDSEYYLYYLLGAFERGSCFYISSGMLEANMKYYIRTYNHTDLSKISGMHLQAIWLNEGKYIRKEPLDLLIDLTIVNFNKESYFRENEYFDYKAVLFPVATPEMIKRNKYEPEKESAFSDKKTITKDKKGDSVQQRRILKDTYELDLHIDNLVENSSDYSPSKILSLQIRRFHESIEEAMSKKMRRLVIIHGVGQGILKMQIIKELKDKYPEFLFQDASFKEYGFGATLVHLHNIKKQ